MHFPSKRDLWLGLIIWIVLGGSFIKTILDSIWLGAALLSPAVLLWIWMWFGTGYTVTENELKVRCGPFRKTIALKEIIKVEKTDSILSSPALSMDRLEVEYGHYNQIIISPINQDAFISLLRERCPQLDGI